MQWVMFWKRRKKPSAKPPSPRPARLDDISLTEQTLDALADVLRVLGEKGFDLDSTSRDEVEEAFQKWARHILIGTPAIAQHEMAEKPEPGGEAGFERDFRNLRHFVSDHRCHEHDYVTTSLANLRDAIWSMVQGLRLTVTADRNADGKASVHLRKLAAAVESNSTERIKHEAGACVEAVGRVIEQRTYRQSEQVEALGERLCSMRNELERARAQTERDSLTDLYNRAAFDERLGQLVELGFLFDEPSYLLMIDIDHFKWVNDTYGHPCGDRVLRRTADCLARSFQSQEDFVARYGGEEFAVLLRIDSEQIARKLAERVLYAVHDLEIQHQEEQIRISVSIGVARLEPGEDGKSWLERADAALYDAKESGRDRISFQKASPEEG